MFRDINFKVFRKLLCKSKLTSITIDIDSSVVNVKSHQEGTAKGYNPKKRGNSENYIKKAKDDMAVGHLLLLSF
jgi:hypothetical protein